MYAQAENGKRDFVFKIYSQAAQFLLNQTKFLLLSTQVGSNYSTSTPVKPDDSTTIVNTSTQSGNVNLKLVLYHLTNPVSTLGSSSSDSDIEVIPLEKQPLVSYTKS